MIMEISIFLLVLLAILVLLTGITILGHLIWVVMAAILRWIFAEDSTERPPSLPSGTVSNRHDDLTATERQIVKFYSEGKLNDETYEQLMRHIRAERDGFAPPEPSKPRPPGPEPTPEPAA